MYIFNISCVTVATYTEAKALTMQKPKPSWCLQTQILPKSEEHIGSKTSI